MPRTRRWDALGFAFRVSADDETLIESLERMFHCLPRGDVTDGEYLVGRPSPREPGSGYEVTLGGRRIAYVQTTEELPSVLVHAVTRDALAGSRSLVLHAGGVEHGGVAMALPGVSDVGKSTLVAALVRAGMGYLTDEALAVNRDSLQVVAYPKPLSIDREAWALFPELVASGSLPPESSPARQWEVAPDALRPDPVGQATPIRFVVFPRYQAGRPTSLEPISRGAAVIEAAQHTFDFSSRPRDNLDLLADVMRGAACFRLTAGAFDPTVRLLLELFEPIDGPEPGVTRDGRFDERVVPARRDGVHTIEIDGEAVLLDEVTGRLHLLNVTGALVWSCFDGVSSLSEIVDDLSNELGVPKERIAAESLAILQQLSDEELLAEHDAG